MVTSLRAAMEAAYSFKAPDALSSIMRRIPVAEADESGYTYTLKGIHHRMTEQIYRRVQDDDINSPKNHRVTSHLVEKFHPRPTSIPDQHFYNYMTNEVIPSYGKNTEWDNDMPMHHGPYVDFHEHQAEVSDDPTSYEGVGVHFHDPDHSVFAHEMHHSVKFEYLPGKEPPVVPR